VEEKKTKQQTEHDEFEKQKNNQFKAVAKTVKLSGRDKKEKDLMKLKYDRMNSAMKKIVKRSNMEFM
jgi:hypothetical protein